MVGSGQMLTCSKLTGTVMTTSQKYTQGLRSKKGCGCKTGCMINRCKCRKSGNQCGPGCACLSCCNLPAKTSPDQVEVEMAETVNPESDASDSDLEAEVDDIMYRVLGVGNEYANRESGCGDTNSCSSKSDTEPETSDDDMDMDSSNL